MILSGAPRKRRRRRGRRRSRRSEADWLHGFQAQFQEAIDDDLNMPRALATVHDLIREANRCGAQAAALPLLFDWDAVLGLRLADEARRDRYAGQRDRAAGATAPGGAGSQRLAAGRCHPGPDQSGRIRTGGYSAGGALEAGRCDRINSSLAGAGRPGLTHRGESKDDA